MHEFLIYAGGFASATAIFGAAFVVRFLRSIPPYNPPINWIEFRSSLIGDAPIVPLPNKSLQPQPGVHCNNCGALFQPRIA